MFCINSPCIHSMKGMQVVALIVNQCKDSYFLYNCSYLGSYKKLLSWFLVACQLACLIPCFLDYHLFLSSCLSLERPMEAYLPLNQRSCQLVFLTLANGKWHGTCLNGLMSPMIFYVLFWHGVLDGFLGPSSLHW